MSQVLVLVLASPVLVFVLFLVGLVLILVFVLACPVIVKITGQRTRVYYVTVTLTTISTRSRIVTVNTV